MARPRISIVGPFPPPVHGAAEVTRKVAEALERSAAVERLSNAPQAGSTGLAYHASRLARVLAAAQAIAAARGPVYLSAAGGHGLGYDVLMAALARLLRRPVFVHHHSFAYLDRRDVLALLLVRAAGPLAVHVCLCSRMAERLAAIYGPVRTEIVSNAAFLPAVGDGPVSSDRPIRIGHLGTLSREKGLDLVLELATALGARGLAVDVVLAGPNANPDAEKILKAARRQLGSRLIELGPVYGPDKERFFAAADVLVFPTRYVNEAEPLVVFEALAHGLPVIAFARGCIAEQVGDAGILVKPNAEFVEIATATIVTWSQDRSAFENVRANAWRRMMELHAEALPAFDRFCRRIVQSAADAAGSAR